MAVRYFVFFSLLVILVAASTPQSARRDRMRRGNQEMQMAHDGKVNMMLRPELIGSATRQAKIDDSDNVNVLLQVSDGPNLIQSKPSTFNPTSPDLFEDSHGKAIPFGKEAPEHQRLMKWIKPDAKVMELGTRYGSSSCVISWIQHNSGQLVSVEGDSTVWEANRGNMKRLNCKNQLWQGFVSQKKWKKSQTKNGSEWTTKFEVTDQASEANVPSATFDEVEKKTGITFDTFLIDCEGCFDNFLQEFPDAVNKVHTILLEADYGIGMQRMGYADYSRVSKFLQDKGFDLKENELAQDKPLEGDGKIPFYVFQRPSTT